jgi:tRNA_anti-like/zinc-ribbon domain
MALTECPECGKQVSEQAATCPHCGFPLGAHKPNLSTQAERPSIRREIIQETKRPDLARVVLIACVLLGGATVLVIGRRTNTEVVPSTAGPIPERATPKAELTTRGKLPEDPPPSSADKAAEVPALEAKLVNGSAYLGLWQPARRADRLLFLSAVSEIAATMNGAKANIAEARSKRLENRELLQPVITLTMIFARIGRYPAHFDHAVRGLLTEMRPLPRLGLCGAVNDSNDAFDISALGAWMMRDRPEYFRALLACRREKAFGWPAVSSPALSYIQTERGALERLAPLDNLAETERDRLDELKLPTVDATELWRAYDANEVAADNVWKGNRILITGEVAGISKDFTDAIFIQLRSPNEFMPTPAYVKDTSAPKAARLKKRQKIVLTCTCTGKVMASPVLKDCVIRT